MADADAQTDLNKAAHKTADAAADTAHAGIEAEQRSFGAARDAGRQGAEAITHAARASLKNTQDLARQATTTAAEFWRSSLTPMSQLQGLFEQMWRQPARMPLGGLFMAPFGGQPLADLRETDKGLELRVELPGLKAEDIDLSLRGDALILSGEKADESVGTAGAFHFSERRFGHFERSFPLPAGADRSNIDASFQDGLLRVAIPLAKDGQEETPIRVKG